MKSLLVLAFVLSVGFAAYASPTAVVVLHPTASVSGDSFYLGDIATVTSKDTSFRTRLLAATMGRAPLPGLNRPFDIGDVSLKLRQAGFDPETMSISGPTNILVVGASGPASTNVAVITNAPATASSSSPASSVMQPEYTTAPKSIVIHRGDKVTLVYDADGMAISADVVATSDGGVGDTISLRRDGAAHTLSGIVQDAQTVKMME